MAWYMYCILLNHRITCEAGIWGIVAARHICFSLQLDCDWADPCSGCCSPAVLPTPTHTASVLCSARPFSLPALFHLGHKRARLTNNEIRPTACPSFQLLRPSEPAGGYRTLSPDWLPSAARQRRNRMSKIQLERPKKAKWLWVIVWGMDLKS